MVSQNVQVVFPKEFCSPQGVRLFGDMTHSINALFGVRRYLTIINNLFLINIKDKSPVRIKQQLMNCRWQNCELLAQFERADNSNGLGKHQT